MASLVWIRLAWMIWIRELSKSLFHLWDLYADIFFPNVVRF